MSLHADNCTTLTNRTPTQIPNINYLKTDLSDSGRTKEQNTTEDFNFTLHSHDPELNQI